MKKKKNKELSKDQALKFFQMGEKIAEKLKLRERIEKFNQYGNENPQKAFGWIFIVIFASFIIGLLYPRPEMKEVPMQVPQTNVVKEKQINEELNREMKDLYKEMEYLTDTLGKLMDKDTLTQADSIFLVQKFSRLEALDKALNEQINN